MKAIKSVLALVAVGGLLLGIVYNLFLGFTPVWLDITVALIVGLAFLIAFVLSRGQSATEEKSIK